METNFVEKYPRPCFASCSSGKQGVIVLQSGLSTGIIQSHKEGKKVLAELISTKSLSLEDAVRIEDHFNCSDLPIDSESNSPTSSLLNSLLFALAMKVLLLKDDTVHHRHKCNECGKEWEHGEDCMDKEEEHTCPNCGEIQWARTC